ncbi:Cystathionine beta-synthase [Colletotrichum sp. SAR 10_65]|nr:Cystathionine beta-synthase [Colletotrichum sp. SAR 10_75]KAI8195093.1 Cystathionine beta-synthase [Colletotrichum sp. SAR 10_65]KAI8210986.1 Cystathionine beta-synthase [Colletotrichum sp. SAR 10_76]KAJ5003920.1 Cystathionine beta-synthase [Colletotrichum sp. SAR 10_66]
MIRLNTLPQSEGIKAEVLAKLEYHNAGGSVKDRVAKAMVEKAEQEGRLKPGDTLIEATSGNTGIALALMAAVKGYKCIITISEKMSEEKVLVLKSLGAKIVRTPAGVPITSPDSIISVARRLNASTPDSHILNQYTNPNNPLAHELGTAPEIWTQCGGKVDIVVAGAGTGGTVTGLARGLRRQNSGVVIVGADPVGSVLAQPGELNAEKGEYRVEGIGYDFVPGVLDQSAANVWVKTGDEEAFGYASRLIREEGLLCGGSSGAAMAALVKFMRRRPEMNREDVRVVVIFPDGVRNYLTKFVDDGWMERNGMSS